MTAALREIDCSHLVRTTRTRKRSGAVADDIPVEDRARRIVRREHVFDAQGRKAHTQLS
jgi:hypothetical protein